MKVLISTLALITAFALPAEAQLKLQINNGRVTLEATNVPARQILSEWARIGGTKIVGGEKVTGAPLTLKLVDVPEKQALDIILRNVAGFMAAPRLASATPGASAYDRILIMATSSAPAPTAAAGRAGAGNANAGNAMNGMQRRVPGRPPSMPPAVADEPADDDQEPDEVDDQAETGAMETPVFTFPSPGVQQANPQQQNPVFVPMPGGTFSGQPPGTVTAPVITLQPGANGPTTYNFVPTDPNQQQAPPATPQTGFGVVGAPTPGMIQVPPQTGPGGRPTRPPGGEN
jgi:hypothetical protein